MRKTGVLTIGMVAAVKTPILVAAGISLGLALIAIVTLTGILAKRKARRDAAYALLALILGQGTSIRKK